MHSLFRAPTHLPLDQTLLNSPICGICPPYLEIAICMKQAEWAFDISEILYLLVYMALSTPLV